MLFELIENPHTGKTLIICREKDEKNEGEQCRHIIDEIDYRNRTDYGRGLIRAGWHYEDKHGDEGEGKEDV